MGKREVAHHGSLDDSCQPVGSRKRAPSRPDVPGERVSQRSKGRDQRETRTNTQRERCVKDQKGPFVGEEKRDGLSSCKQTDAQPTERSRRDPGHQATTQQERQECTEWRECENRFDDQR
jgi:hypothetical protein